MTRRELLAGAGLGALWLAGCGGDVAVPLTPATPSRPAMLKGISLIGAVNRWDDSLGVRPYLLGGPHPAQFVSLWVLWTAVQPVAPEPFTRAQAFRDLSGSGVFADLDAQIASANADGRTVALTVYQAFPAWARRRRLPRGPGEGALSPESQVPDDLTPDGPWAWFVAYLCARYADTDGEPTPGPGRGGAQVGNPAGAHVDWLAPMNEPNLTWWPQAGIAERVAEMARTAANVAAAYRTAESTPRGPALLLPGTADVVSAASPHGTPWGVFTDELLASLRGWRPGVPVAWAHHNYADVKHGPQPSGRWRVEDVLDLQRRHGWPEPSVWLTEGGYQFAVRRVGTDHYAVAPQQTADPAQPDALAEQVAKIGANWDAMARLPVRLWTQYLVNDQAERFQSSLRGTVQATPAGLQPRDPPYPAYALWPTLSA